MSYGLATIIVDMATIFTVTTIKPFDTKDQQAKRLPEFSIFMSEKLFSVFLLLTASAVCRIEAVICILFYE